MQEVRQIESSVRGKDQPFCPVIMGNGVRCGRPLRSASAGVDPRPLCLMHSADPAKASGPPLQAFLAEFEAILEAAGDDVARFDRFVFPALDLTGRTLRPTCWFRDAVFTRPVCFRKTTFLEDAHFDRSIFLAPADFSKTIFVRDARMTGTTFSEDADFSRATFTRSANFQSTRFLGIARWRNAHFQQGAIFQSTRFNSEIAIGPSATFVSAVFSEPRHITFDNVDLSRVLFLNANVRDIRFTSSVRWARRRHRTAIVFDEIVSLQQALVHHPGTRPERDYVALEQLYLQLKNNYDSRRNHRPADQFHYGQMEMRRLSPARPGRLYRLRRWAKPRLGLTAWFKYASDYQNSFAKPFLWMVVVVSLLAVVFGLPWIGLRSSETASHQTWPSVWSVGQSLPENLHRESNLFGQCLVAAVGIMAFPRRPYTPNHLWVQSLGILETALICTLFGLFLLAFRRRFRR